MKTPSRVFGGRSRGALDLEGAVRLGAETPRRIANTHTTFNVVNTLIFLPFTGLLAALAAVAGQVQHVGETNAVNVVGIGRERLARGVSFSTETVERARALGDKAREAFDMAVRSLEQPDLAQRVIAMKEEVQQLVSEIVEHLGRRLSADAPDRALLYRLESQAVELIQREYYFAKKIAKEVVRETEASIEDPVLEKELADGKQT